MIPPPPGRHDPYAAFRSVCRSCQARILWAETTNGQRMPVDEKPNQLHGNVLLEFTDDSPAPKLLAAVLTRGQAAGARAEQKRLYVSHFKSCPDADRHRRSRNKTKRWRRT